MEHDEPVVMRTAKILGIAGTVAGVAGALTGRIVQGRRQPPARTRLQRALNDLSGGDAVSLDELKANVAEALGDVTHAAAEDFTTAVRNRGKRGRRFGRSRPGTAEMASKLGRQLKDVAQHRAEAALEELEERGESLGEQAEDLSDTTLERVQKGRKDMVKFRKRANRNAEDRLHDIEKKSRQTFEKQVRPMLEKAGDRAMERATQARKRLEEETRDLEKRYEKARPGIEESAARYSDLAADIGAEFLGAAEQRADDAERVLRENAMQARMRARDAGDAARQGGRSLRSFVLWTSVGAVVAYVILLNDDQKRRAREMAGSAFREGRAMYQDVRGQNAEFGAEEE